MYLRPFFFFFIAVVVYSKVQPGERAESRKLRTVCVSSLRKDLFSTNILWIFSVKFNGGKMNAFKTIKINSTSSFTNRSMHFIPNF